MFTGIVQSIGRIAAVDPIGDGARLIVSPGGLAIADVAVGDSIAVSGCCLTVIGIEREKMLFDASAETLRLTTGLDRPGPVNLEKALRLADRLGGHLMAGHVDGVGAVIATEAIADGGSMRIEVELPSELARFVAPKGSIAIDGVSLTTNDVTANRFGVNLIPHTLAVTTLGALTPGARVNIEVDMVARYVARLHGSQ